MEQPNDAQPQQEKKIIIDEDWKAQVQAEKEKAAAEASAAPSEQAKTEQGQTEKAALPPPSLTLLATTLGMQSMMALGLMADPATGKGAVDLDRARHFIDTLAMLQEKTQGNRTPEESSVLENLLHELRMGYVAVKQRNPA